MTLKTPFVILDVLSYTPEDRSCDEQRVGQDPMAVAYLELSEANLFARYIHMAVNKYTLISKQQTSSKLFQDPFD